MGKKSKSKTKSKKAVKKAAKAKGKSIGVVQASKIVKQADKAGIDPVELLSSAVSSIPFVGGIASNLIDQSSAIAQSQASGGRGGVRGVQLIDSKLGNIGTISRKKALSILVNRNRRPPRRSSKTVAVLRAGESIQVVK